MFRRPRSISAKLNRLVVISIGLALGLTGALSVYQEADRYLASKRDTLLATAQAIAAATSEAVAAGDERGAVKGLRAIARIPGVLRAQILDRDGRTLAEIGSVARLGGDLDLDSSGMASRLGLVTGQTVQVSAPVVNAGSTVGRILIVSDTSDLAARFRDVLLTAAAAAAGALALGLGLSHALQRSITKPLLKLTAAMNAVEQTKTYAPVTGIDTDDETGRLARQFNSMIGEIRRATDEILAREGEIIARLSRAGEQRDDQTGQHVIRVAAVSGIIARKLGLDPKWTDDLCRASPMHDVGKISIPDSILFKPGRLDPEERRRMERHAQAGYEVLAGSRSQLVQLAAEIAISHHERWDGEGYPNRIAGAAIPLSGRITAVADVCDALLSERPYKKPWTLEAVKAHLLENAGTHFDPACVEALVESWPELERIYRPLSGPEDMREAA